MDSSSVEVTFFLTTRNPERSSGGDPEIERKGSDLDFVFGGRSGYLE